MRHGQRVRQAKVLVESAGRCRRGLQCVPARCVTRVGLGARARERERERESERERDGRTERGGTVWEVWLRVVGEVQCARERETEIHRQRQREGDAVLEEPTPSARKRDRRTEAERRRETESEAEKDIAAASL